MEREKSSLGYGILVGFLCLVLGLLGGYILSDKVLTKKCDEPVKIEDSKSDSVDSYQKFSKKLKSELSRFNSNDMAYQSVSSSVVGNYVAYLNDKGSLYVKYFNNDLNSKYGDYKISDGILSFYIVPSGQGGGNVLYFINEDGTVGSADVEYGANSNITIKNDLGYKNIVSVVSGGFGMEYSGGYSAIFIDIDGNMYNPNLK